MARMTNEDWTQTDNPFNELPNETVIPVPVHQVTAREDSSHIFQC